MLQHHDNLFAGINPHLMSFLQTPGTGATTSTYPSFHKDHITHIKDFLNEYLPPQYIALSEPSLQIQGRESLQEPFTRDSQPIPDVAVYQSRQRPSSDILPAQAASPTLQLALNIELEPELTSVGIYELKTVEHGVHGAPVVRLELLSPANMPGNSYDRFYQQSRAKCLIAGTPLVEIDYLHEYASPVKGVPAYPADPAAKPYNITVSHPQTQRVDVYLFGINAAIPRVLIPLAGTETIPFDFGEPYRFTWQKSRFWFYVDYSQEPPRMDTYSLVDQQAIRDQMQVIARR